MIVERYVWSYGWELEITAGETTLLKFYNGPCSELIVNNEKVPFEVLRDKYNEIKQIVNQIELLAIDYEEKELESYVDNMQGYSKWIVTPQGQKQIMQLITQLEQLVSS